MNKYFENFSGINHRDLGPSWDQKLRRWCGMEAKGDYIQGLIGLEFGEKIRGGWIGI